MEIGLRMVKQLYLTWFDTLFVTIHLVFGIQQVCWCTRDIRVTFEAHSECILSICAAFYLNSEMFETDSVQKPFETHTLDFAQIMTEKNMSSKSISDSKWFISTAQ